MGRTEASVGRPPAAFRKDVRAKQAKATLNKVIPSILSAHPRARRGIAASELIVAPKAQSSKADKPKIDTDQPAEAQVGPRLTIQATDTLTAAHSLLTNNNNSVKKVAILNMASPLAPGGGFLNGATNQETLLCHRTTLLPALRDEFYRLPEVGCIYTPDVLVFRSVADGDDDVLHKNDRWFVDVVSAGMLRLPEIEVDDETGHAEFVQAKDRESTIEKMRAVMRVLQAKGVVKVVLGAWGCDGASCNPLGEIARAWKKVLLPSQKKTKHKRKGSDGQAEESWHDFEEVTFAIKDQNMAEAFQSAFGKEVEWVDEAEAGGTDEDEEKEEDATGDQVQVDELLERIHGLRLRIDGTSNDGLKKGLQAIITGLQNQLPGNNGVSNNQAEELEDGNESQASGDAGEESEEDDGIKSEEEEEGA